VKKVPLVNSTLLPDFATSKNYPRAYPQSYRLISLFMYIIFFGSSAALFWLHQETNRLNDHKLDLDQAKAAAITKKSEAEAAVESLYAEQEKSYALNDWLILHPALQPLIVRTISGIDKDVLISQLGLKRDPLNPQYEMQVVLSGPPAKIDQSLDQISHSIRDSGWLEVNYTKSPNKDVTTANWEIQKTNLPALSTKPTRSDRNKFLSQ
jgi:hypothetical protein